MTEFKVPPISGRGRAGTRPRFRRPAWIFHQGASPLVFNLWRAMQKRNFLGGTSAMQSCFLGKSIRALTPACVPGHGLRPSDSYGYPLRSSPASRLAYPSPSSRVLGEISGLILLPGRIPVCQAICRWPIASREPLGAHCSLHVIRLSRSSPSLRLPNWPPGRGNPASTRSPCANPAMAGRWCV